MNDSLADPLIESPSDPGQFHKVLISMVGERGFEPPTPWSRTENVIYNQQLANRNRGASIA
jgi:hypothetical protein